MKKTAVAAPAQWQEIFDALDKMSAEEVHVVAYHLLIRAGTISKPLPQNYEEVEKYAMDYFKIMKRGQSV